MRYAQSIGITLSVLFLFSSAVLAAPDPSLNRRERLLGSNEKHFFIYVTEIENPGSHYQYIERRSVSTYSTDTGKLVGTERVLETDNYRNPDDPQDLRKTVNYQKTFDLDEYVRSHRVKRARQEQKPKGVKMKLGPQKLMLERGASRLTVRPKQSLKTLYSQLYRPYGKTRISTLHRDRKNIYFSIHHDNMDGDELRGVICFNADDYNRALAALRGAEGSGSAVRSPSRTAARSAGATTDYYSIQIKALRLSQKNVGLALYKDLKRRDYLVYYYKARVKGGWWMRLRVGVFPSAQEAQEFGVKFRNKEGFDFVVTKANVLVHKRNDTFNVITTPSAVWVQSGARHEEAFVLDSKTIHTAEILSDFHAGSQEWIRTIESGKPFTVVFDKTDGKFDDAHYTGSSRTDPMGTIKGGETYTCTYRGSTFACTGFNQGTGGVGTWEYSNAALSKNQFSLWGRILIFDGKGNVYDPDYGLVGEMHGDQSKR